MTHCVVAVVVTWNRRDLLLESLAALAAQTRPPDRVVVVDNSSTDGTSAAVAEAFPAVELTTTAANLGGAGGFALGLTRALDGPADAVWLMDDDTVPTPTALAELLAARDGYPGERPALVASRVVWTDGRDHPMNTPRPRPLASRAARAAAAQVGAMPVRSASFVSVLLDAAACRATALPVADYFLWNDDFEYTTRLLRHGVGLYVPASVVVHKTRTFGSTDADPGPRFFYEVRNKIWLITRSPALAPWERVLYIGASLRRWIRTFARSRSRGVLAAAFGRGVLAGARSGPRPTADVLAAASDR